MKSAWRILRHPLVRNSWFMFVAGPQLRPALTKLRPLPRHRCQTDSGDNEQAYPLGYSSLFPRDVTMSIPPLIGNGP